jgi:hypothetical protein
LKAKRKLTENLTPHGSQKLQASTNYWALHSGCSVAQLHSEFPREIAIVAAFIS